MPVQQVAHRHRVIASVVGRAKLHVRVVIVAVDTLQQSLGRSQDLGFAR